MQEIIYNNMHQFTSIGKWRVTDTQNKDLILLGIVLLRCKTGTYYLYLQTQICRIIKKDLRNRSLAEGEIGQL